MAVRPAAIHIGPVSGTAALGRRVCPLPSPPAAEAARAASTGRSLADGPRVAAGGADALG